MFIHQRLKHLVVGCILLFPGLINSRSQVSDPGPEGLFVSALPNKTLNVRTAFLSYHPSFEPGRVAQSVTRLATDANLTSRGREFDHDPVPYLRGD